LIVLPASGCATLEEWTRQQEAREHLDESQDLVTRGEFASFLEINEKVLADFPKNPPGDEALFNLGLLFAHPDNPKKDYKISRDFFKWIRRDFPKSPLSGKVKIWEETLGSLIELEKQVGELKAQTEAGRKKLERLEELVSKQEEAKAEVRTLREPFQQGLAHLANGDFEGAIEINQKILARYGQKPPGDEALHYLALIYSHPGNPGRDYKKSIIFFKRLIKEFPQSPFSEEAKVWMGILNVIEKTKEIDIEIQQKKKQLKR
jgi:outer membrane protein assembly factor BamD (BamD/ComL family)